MIVNETDVMPQVEIWRRRCLLSHVTYVGLYMYCIPVHHQLMSTVYTMHGQLDWQI